VIPYFLPHFIQTYLIPVEEGDLIVRALITKTSLHPKTMEHVIIIKIRTAKVVGKPKNTDNIRPIVI